MDLIKYIKFQPGDINGLLQLFFDNLGTLLGLIAVLTFDSFAAFNVDLALAPDYPDQVNDIIFQRAVPGLGFTLVFGNIYYSYMGLKLMKKKEEAGDDSPTTALPYGINTPGAFAFAFNIILPAVINGQFAGDCRLDDSGVYLGNLSADAYAECVKDVAEEAWRVGVTSNFLAGIISVGLGFVGNEIPKVTPVLALLTALAGIGISFLGIGFLGLNYAEPIAGLLPFFLIFMTFFADISFGVVPIAAVVVGTGTILGWADEVLLPEDLESASELVKAWGPSTGFEALSDWSLVGEYFGITLPVAIAAAAGSLMNVYSARRAGDDYGVAETMISDGVGTMVGAIFGTPFGTSVYIGHPAYKKMGAGTLYSVFNCFFFFIFSMFGIFGLLGGLIPTTAVGPVLIFVGLSICKEAIEEAKPRHYPAYMVGILPDFVRWVTQQGATFVGSNVHWGLVALSKSSLLVSLVLTAICVFLVDRKFLVAAGWLVAAAILSAFSIIHQSVAGIDYFDEHGFNGGDPDNCFVGFGYCVGVEFETVDNETVPVFQAFTQKTTPVRFMGAYLMVAAVALLFHLFQTLPPEGSRFKLPPPIVDDNPEPEFKETKNTVSV